MLHKKLILIWLLAAMTGPPVAAQKLPQPACLGPIGVRDLVKLNPQLTGATVLIGMVELCQPTTADDPGFAFLPDFSHPAFNREGAPELYFYENPHRPARTSAHASMIAGILTGNDQNGKCEDLGPFYYLGAVPQAGLNVYETNWFLYHCALRVKAKPVKEDVLSISWGADANDGITMLWQNGIDALVVRDSCIIVAGCGNGQGEISSINKPSWGYNVISVGAAAGLGEFPDNLYYVGPPRAEYSSYGPTDDGRTKPDVLAGGLCLGPQDDAQASYYRYLGSVSYTSFAAPQVAGVAALLIDAARQNNIPEGDDPRLIKALILNGANKLIGWHKGACTLQDDPYVPLDYRQGAGLVNALNSYRQLMAGPYLPQGDPEVEDAGANIGWDLAEVIYDNSSEKNMKMYHLPRPLEAGRSFKATLTWYRRYQQTGVFAPLPLEKLTLELWSSDKQGRLLSRLAYSAGDRDNLQHIYYHNQKKQNAILIVRADPNEAPASAQGVRYGLAYSDADGNWSGDQFAADFNADGIVDQNDLMRFVKVWRVHAENPDLIQQSAYLTHLPEDINSNGRFDPQDLNIFLAQWKKRSVWCRGK
ncbi:S8 family serine peptidase [Planctomycetota bacterium]